VKGLIRARPGFNKPPGGDFAQLSETARHLQQLGVEATLSAALYPPLDDIDVVHLANTNKWMVHWCYAGILCARERSKPVVVSTIYWPWDEEEQEVLRRRPYGWTVAKALPKRALPVRVTATWARARNARSGWPKGWYAIYHSLQRKYRSLEMQQAVWGMADVLLPNSRIEADILKTLHGVQTPCVVVPTAVDPKFAQGDANCFAAKYGLQDFVLCVAAIHERKNQLSLIQAMRAVDLPLVLIGAANTRYARLCKERAHKNVHFLPPMSQEELADAYAAAKVHALPTFFETSGLASLEAAIAGGNVVTTVRGSTVEYFQDMAWYCSPTDVDSIKQAILEAAKAPRSTRLRDYILAEFTWERAAQRTLEAYQLAVRMQGKKCAGSGSGEPGEP